jgi:hypothetical protein
MSIAQPNPQPKETATDSPNAIVVFATGPADLTVRPTQLRHLRRPPPPRPQPPAGEGNTPPEGPEPR